MGFEEKLISSFCNLLKFCFFIKIFIYGKAQWFFFSYFGAVSISFFINPKPKPYLWPITSTESALFNASCFALLPPAFTFAIRAGMTSLNIGDTFGLGVPSSLAFINSDVWFLGFPISMILGGLLYHKVGPANILLLSWHLWLHTLRYFVWPFCLMDIPHF